MFEFGRELKRILGAEADHGELDPGLLELFDAAMLTSQAKATDVDAGRVSTADPYPMWLKSAAIWREQARRSGDVIALRKAAAGAQSAWRAAHNDKDIARAALEQALASLTGVDLFGDLELLTTASDALKVAAGASGDPLFEARLEAAWARLASREALARNDYDRALEAAALFDSAIHNLSRLVHDGVSSIARLEAASARIERSDLLAGFGVRLHETRLMSEAIDDLERLLTGLDADYEPLSWARAAEVLGSTLVALGEMEGRADHIVAGVSALSEAGQRFSRSHSPLDWARRQHALGVGLQALGETLDNDEAFDQAAAAFDEASAILGTAPLAIRATVASNRAAFMARSAERRGDLVALGRAETAFKVELAAADAVSDPVSWAVLQVNLARVYESRAELMGEFADREAAVYALEEALDVFCDHGLKGMADTATSGLERIRAAA